MNKRFLLVVVLSTIALTAGTTLGITQFLSTQNSTEEVSDPIVAPQTEEESTGEITEAADPIEAADPTGKITRELQNRNWIKADLESERYLIEILNKQRITTNDLPKQAIETNDIAQLQCQALEEVDQLWDTYSGGVFGYSNLRHAYLRQASSSLLQRLITKESYLTLFEANIYRTFFTGTSGDQRASIPLQTVFITAIVPKSTQESVERFIAMNSRLEECGIGEIPQVNHYYYCNKPTSGFQSSKPKQYADDNIRSLMVVSYHVRNLEMVQLDRPFFSPPPSYYLVDEGCPPGLIASNSGAEYKKCFDSYIPATDNECNLWKDY